MFPPVGFKGNLSLLDIFFCGGGLSKWKYQNRRRLGPGGRQLGAGNGAGAAAGAADVGGRGMATALRGGRAEHPAAQGEVGESMGRPNSHHHHIPIA